MKIKSYKNGTVYGTSKPVYMGNKPVIQNDIHMSEKVDTWTFSYNESTLSVSSVINLEGNVKDAAKALIFDIINDEAILTTYNNVLSIYHSSSKFGLDCLTTPVPEFFEELNQEFINLKSLRTFL